MPSATTEFGQPRLSGLASSARATWCDPLTAHRQTRAAAGACRSASATTARPILISPVISSFERASRRQNGKWLGEELTLSVQRPVRSEQRQLSRVLVAELLRHRPLAVSYRPPQPPPEQRRDGRRHERSDDQRVEQQ